jgi:hypothetical protein
MAAKKTVTAKSTVSTHRRAAQGKSVSAPKQRTAASSRSAKADDAGDELVTIDRRRNGRRGAEEEATGAEAAPLERRKKVQRRRQIDPTTCERDYSVEEVEFMNAMDDYKRKSGRMFPTCSEVLEVIRSLGYVQLSPAGRSVLAEQLNVVGDAALVEADELEAAELAF